MVGNGLCDEQSLASQGKYQVIFQYNCFLSCSLSLACILILYSSIFLQLKGNLSGGQLHLHVMILPSRAKLLFPLTSFSPLSQWVCRCSFYLHPCEGSTVQILTQGKLSAPRILRIHKVSIFSLNLWFIQCCGDLQRPLLATHVTCYVLHSTLAHFSFRGSLTNLLQNNLHYVEDEYDKVALICFSGHQLCR